jgi:hypothetical protein
MQKEGSQTFGGGTYEPAASPPPQPQEPPPGRLFTSYGAEFQHQPNNAEKRVRVVQSASMLNNDFFDLTELRSAITARITA